MKKKKQISLLCKRQLANMIESYAAIVSIPDYDIKEYAKAAIRDIFIQMPSRSVTYENWGGFKQYVVGFFGEDSYNIAMEELQKDGWLTEGKTRYEWKKMYGPVIQKQQLKEWADVVIVYKNGVKKTYSYLDNDAYPFGYDIDDDEMYLSDAGEIHGSKTGDYDVYKKGHTSIRGRVWTKDKIMSFWKYPTSKTQLNNLIEKLNEKLKEKNLPTINYGWKIDIPITEVNLYNPDRFNMLDDEHYDDEIYDSFRDIISFLVPISQWKPDIVENPKKYLSKMNSNYIDKRFKLDKKYADKIGPGYSLNDVPAFVKHGIETTSDSVINNKPILESQLQDDYKDYIPKLSKFMIKKGMKIVPLPKVKIRNNEVKNSESIFGKTAHYDIDLKEITLFTLNRHPKDILRSFAHEMVHHEQNLNGLLNNINSTNTNEDDHMEEFEKEAYEKGNIMLRNWEDSIKQNTQELTEEYTPKLNDAVEIPEIFFMDKKLHQGEIILISPDKSRLQISSKEYPYKFWISTEFVTPIKKQNINEIQTEYGCLMLKMNFPGWNKFVDTYVKDEDLYDNTAQEYGRDHEAHVTILYGFNEGVDVEKIKQIVQSLKNEVRITTDKINTFTTKNFDVVKFEVHSVMLSKLNEIMKKNFKYTTSHNDYNAHMTIAYVKPGLGEKYVKNLNKTISLSSGTFMYSYPGGKKEEFNIKKIE